MGFNQLKYGLMDINLAKILYVEGLLFNIVIEMLVLMVGQQQSIGGY